MDETTQKYLGALRSVNESLIGGLETAISILKNVDKLPPERRQFLIDKLKELISMSKQVYGNEPTKH